MATSKVTHNEDGSVTHSFKLSEMTLAELEQIDAGLGRQIDKLRFERQGLKGYMAAARKQHQLAALRAQLAAAEAQIDGVAPGAVVDLKAQAE